MLEDFQKVLSVNIDEEDEKTLSKISQDFSTLRNIWRKVRLRPTEALSGKLLALYASFWLLPILVALSTTTPVNIVEEIRLSFLYGRLFMTFSANALLSIVSNKTADTCKQTADPLNIFGFRSI